ncbi:MAG: Ig domain-containing protein [Comamonas sp.]
MKISTIAVFSVACAAVLSACGGGGGSPGVSHGPYVVTMTADRTLLPTNTVNAGPGIGVYAPFTTTVYVKATENGYPIPGGTSATDKIFGCNIAGGLNVGSLYYLDGDPDHETEVDNGAGGKIKVPNAYRSITLGSNSGGNSFHFHAGNEAGTVTITCSVQSPQDQKYYSTSLTITVGAASGLPASVTGRTTTSNVLGIQGNTAGLTTTTNIKAQVLDDANQMVPNPTAPNLQVSIRPTGAGVGASLMAGNKTGGTLSVSTIAGLAGFDLSSGATEGSIVLDMTADRSDNDVSNGIQDPVVGVLVVPAVSRVATATTPPSITTAALGGGATVGVPYSFVLEATGGQAPYTWTALGALPAGLTLSSAGVISGTPSAAGTVGFAVRVTDGAGNSANANYSLTVAAGAPAPTPALAIGGCSGATCTLPTAEDGTAYAYTLWTTGGSGTTAPAWSLVGTVPAGITLGATTGTLAWTAPACPAAPAGANPGPSVTVSVTKGTDTLIQAVKIPVTQAGGAACL